MQFPQHFQFCVIPPPEKYSIDGLRNFSRVLTSKLMDFMEEDPEVNELCFQSLFFTELVPSLGRF